MLFNACSLNLHSTRKFPPATGRTVKLPHPRAICFNELTGKYEADVYPDDLPLRDDLRTAHTNSWRCIGAAGAFWTGSQRVAMVAEARHALGCDLCTRRQAALSPFTENGDHDSVADLQPAVVELVHRIRTDPGRLTKSWYDGIIGAGISQGEYVEAVSVVTSSVIIDTLHACLGLPLAELPAAQPGDPDGQIDENAVDEGAWVPITAASQELTDTGLPAVPNIARAMGLVPGAVALFFGTFRPHYALRDIPLAISQAQAEFIASRVSALNQCFY